MELRESHQNDDIEPESYYRLKDSLHGKLLAWDKRLMEKRKMLLQIERENVMTILGALRAIPKKPNDKPAESPMAAFLNRRKGEGGA